MSHIYCDTDFDTNTVHNSMLILKHKFMSGLEHTDSPNNIHTLHLLLFLYQAPRFQSKRTSCKVVPQYQFLLRSGWLTSSWPLCILDHQQWQWGRQWSQVLFLPMPVLTRAPVQFCRHPSIQISAMRPTNLLFLQQFSPQPFIMPWF